MTSQTNMIPAPPISPGDVLRDKFLVNLTQDQLAQAMRVSRFSVNQIVNGRRSLTAEMALRLSKVTSTTCDYWLNLQRAVDVYEARLKLKDELSALEVLRPETPKAELLHDLPED
ncbi:putative transcriptional regulator protein (plasmid) [Rhizobium etli CFN 42]|uniref:Transcriptional regulator protein n=1 Tax=Rhizobium etli (strain ATCC 51251 / DSM 11541 / JCM 21823 / NBRC 15573 / CFN 42) TaxID=347834 RepID=Q2JZH7_RHIEC|nr:HigA family addiction module antitoxin [Rhizobium etli]ABC94009.1 putative transcriptional regulator protein [Rhizobium etli CFN 42]